MGCSSSKPHTTQPYTAAVRPTIHTTQSPTTKTSVVQPKPQTRYSTPTISSTTTNSTPDYGLYIGMGNADTTSQTHSHHSHHTSHDN